MSIFFFALPLFLFLCLWFTFLSYTFYTCPLLWALKRTTYDIEHGEFPSYICLSCPVCLHISASIHTCVSLLQDRLRWVLCPWVHRYVRRSVILLIFALISSSSSPHLFITSSSSPHPHLLLILSDVIAVDPSRDSMTSINDCPHPPFIA